MSINEDKILLKFGENLRKARTEKKISQEDMALKIGFDRTYISLLERGKRNPSLITILRLIAFLKIDIEALFDEEFSELVKEFDWKKQEKSE